MKTYQTNLLDLVLDMKCTSSAGIARDNIREGRVKVGNETITDPKQIILIDSETELEYTGVIFSIGAYHPQFKMGKYMAYMGK